MKDGMSLKQISRFAILILLCGIMTFAFSWNLAMAGFGFAPQQYKSGYAYGNGVYFAPYDLKVYAEPNVNSPVLKELHWSRNTQTNSVKATQNGEPAQLLFADHTFFCFYPELDIAMMAVVSENDNGWVEVIYDQFRDKTGWVPLKVPSSPKSASQNLEPLFETPAHFGVYQTWVEFMKLNARANGIYWLSGVSQYQRSLRSSDTDEAKLVPITIVRDIKVKHVRGNWLLVEILDFERNTPIGWVRWRDNDGNLMVFPNLTGKRSPIVTTAY